MVEGASCLSHWTQWDPNVQKFVRKERRSVKKYLAPEMEVVSFTAEEAVAAPLDGSKLFNDGELVW